MPNISVQVHAVIDYLTGLLLIVSPYFIPYPDNPMKDIAMAFGGAILLYSFMTDYPFGVLRLVPFPIHKGLDLLAGGGLAFAPIHFSAQGLPAFFFVAMGGCLLLMAFLTRGRFSPTGQDNPIVPGA